MVTYIYFVQKKHYEALESAPHKVLDKYLPKLNGNRLLNKSLLLI